MTPAEHRLEAAKNWLRAFWYHDTIDEMQRKMLREIPKRYRLRGMPPGLTWNPDTMTISGTPTRSGSYAFSFPISMPSNGHCLTPPSTVAHTIHIMEITGEDEDGDD